MENFSKAGPNKRVCGYLIDVAVVGIASFFMALFFRNVPQVIVVLLYFLFRDSFDGQSIGKRAVGMQAIGEENEPISFAQGLLRNVIIVIPFLPIIEYFVMKSDPNGQRLGDKLAKSRVQDLKPEMEDGKFLWISIAVFVLYILFSGIMTALFVAPAIRQ